MSSPDFSAINKLTVLLSERRDALTIRWLWATVTIGVFALIVAWFEQGSPRVPGWLTALTWLAACVLAGLSIWLPKQELADKLVMRQLRLSADPQGWARAMKLDPEQTRTLAALPNLEQRLFGLTLLFEKPYTKGLILAGGLAFLGLVYGVLAGTLVEASPALLGALGLNVWHYPRLQPLIDRGRKLEEIAEEEDAVRSLTSMQKEAPRRSAASNRPPARPDAPARPRSSRKS